MMLCSLYRKLIIGYILYVLESSGVSIKITSLTLERQRDRIAVSYM